MGEQERMLEKARNEMAQEVATQKERQQFLENEKYYFCNNCYYYFFIIIIIIIIVIVLLKQVQEMIHLQGTSFVIKKKLFGQNPQITKSC